MAEASDGVVINADSMQVYDGLRVLTARPTGADEARAPHFLYGHVPASQAYSVGRWQRDVMNLMGEPALRNRTLIFAGGTGLYFRALLGGLSEMPAIPDAVRAHWRERLSMDGPQVLHTTLRERDPVIARRLEPGDSQRIVRALEVLEATGQSIDAFQKRPGTALIDATRARKIVVLPDREKLQTRIRNRFETMMARGAVEEVRALIALQLPHKLPAMKAIGVREISSYLDGLMSRAELSERVAIATRQYAKRQLTWFRNQLSEDWERQSGLV